MSRFEDYIKTIAPNIHIPSYAKRFGNVVEVVRCKDCIYYGDHGDGEMACAMMILYPNKPIDYCSLGERREDAEH